MTNFSPITLRAALAAVLVAILVARAGYAATDTGLPPGYPEHVDALDLREVAMLPDYCKYTQIFRDGIPGANDQAKIDRLYASMGPTFHALHHYCFGLMKTNRALFLARTPTVKRFYLDSSIIEFDYVLRSAASRSENFVLLPEILTRKGENLVRLGRGPTAVQQLQHAMELKPDYWPPYAVLSDYYKSAGQIDRAREVLEKGLSLSPEAKGLRTRLAGLRSGTEKQKSSE
jgi:tetratricopeptide (TPR) repeat protein